MEIQIRGAKRIVAIMVVGSIGEPITTPILQDKPYIQLNWEDPIGGEIIGVADMDPARNEYSRALNNGMM
jgi:hypothetical protein